MKATFDSFVLNTAGLELVSGLDPGKGGDWAYNFKVSRG